MQTITDLSVHRAGEGFYVARGFIKAEHRTPLDFRVSGFYADVTGAIEEYERLRAA